MSTLSENTNTLAVTMKGRMVSLMVVELFHADLKALELELEEKTSMAKAFFRNAPVLIDFEHLAEEVDLRWFNNAYDLLYVHSFIPVGVVAPPEYLKQAIAKQQIAIWPSAEAARKAAQEIPDRYVPVSQEEPDPVPESDDPVQQDTAFSEDSIEQQQVQEASIPAPDSEVRQPAAQPTRLVLQPVRSGQKIYAKGGDLIIMASVSTGAEIMADGHIHVYGTLRGRALAGVQGDENARIFCKDLQADLISVAGTYLLNDDIPANLRASCVQIYLRGEQLIIDPL